MTTAMRPILAKPDAGWWTHEKKFFLMHFAETVEGKKETPAPMGQPAQPR